MKSLLLIFTFLLFFSCGDKNSNSSSGEKSDGILDKIGRIFGEKDHGHKVGDCVQSPASNSKWKINHIQKDEFLTLDPADNRNTAQRVVRISDTWVNIPCE